MTNKSLAVSVISNYKLLCNVGRKYVYYSKGKIYLGNEDGKNMSCLLQLSGNAIKRFLIKCRLLERFARLEPRIAVKLDDDSFLISFQGQILRIDLNGDVTCEHKYRAGMNNPISFCTANNRILYGEYFGNISRDEVSVYERKNNTVWEKVYTFKAGIVQHIHQICFDEFRNCYWILTGDYGNECAIWQADINFESVRNVFRGKQKYRSCFIMPSASGIAYSTDTPIEKNSIFFSKQNKDGSWEEPQKIYEMPGPCIYGRKLDDGRYIMATSVEPDSTLPPLRYYFTKKLGKGVQDRSTHLIIGKPEESYRELVSFRKDILRMWLFQFGNMLFPNIENDGRILCTGQSIRKYDGETVEIKIF